jgi:cobalt-zinc-cadmium efflux system membrane fusion protein
MIQTLTEPGAPTGSALRPGRGLLRRTVNAVPTLLIFTLLAGVGFWGHKTGWKLPKLSALTGAEPARADDWCAEHSVPESACVECNESLLPRPKEYGWCRLHGVSECPTCHPELAQVMGTPAPFPYDTLGPLALFPRPENDSRCQAHKRRLQLASAEAADKAGIEVDVVGVRPMTESVAAPGEIIYDPTKVVRLSPRTAGTVWRVFKAVGDPVRPGEVVALVDAAEVGKAKTEYATAAVLARLRAKTLAGLKASAGAVPERQIREAEAAAEEARLRVVAAEQTLANLGLPVPDGADALDAREIVARLRFLGLPADLADRLAADPAATNNLLPVKATQPGVVSACQVVAGETVDPARVLAVTADVRRMWLTLYVRQEDVKYLAVDQPARFRADTGGGELAGTVSWVSTAVDDKTRTVRVRVDLPNPDGTLKGNTFGTGRVVLREERRAVVVPKDAIQSDGCCQIVFIRDRDYLKDGAPKVFHVRQVRPGARDETHVELLAGVLPGEVVVTKGSAALRGELLRGNLGEG